MLTAMGDIPWPFRSTEMLSTGAVTEHYIRTRYRQLYPGIYVPREVEVSATQRAYSAWLWTERRG
ncbi:cullin%2C a subunit of E3 ubiquitin ligase [Mycobacteroides abscessus]|nr:cullin%2C a subunit of E3 ubiquitin ligase [Mycobacteroides abscessus]